MKKRLITMITIMTLVAAFIVPSYGDIWNPGGADIPGGAAALYLAQENGSYAVGSQLNNSGELSGGYLYIKTDVHIDGENGQLHDGKETLEVVGINGSTLDNITSMEKKSGSDWIDVTDSVMNHENAFEQKDQFTNVFRFKLDGDVQFSLQYKVLTDDTPAQYYESPKRYVQVADGAYYYTKYEENVTTEAPSEEPTEVPTEETTEAPTEEPTTEPEVNPNNYKYSYVSYYEEFPDSNDNGVNLVTQQGATVEGVTATASADGASYVIDADPNTIWNASGDDTQWIT